MVKRIWSDPVWSKVISVAILGLASLSYAKFLSITEMLTFKEALEKIINIKVSLLHVLVILIAYWPIRRLLLFKKGNSTYSKKQLQLRKINKTVDPQTGILLKWQVDFNSSDVPFITGLNIFCTKHGNTPLRYMTNRCPIRECPNSKITIDRKSATNSIESELIAQYENLH